MTDEQPPIEYDRIEPVDLNTEMQRCYIDYAMTRHRRPRAARRARRPQAGAPPRDLRDVRRRLPPRPRLQQVLARRRRRHGPVPPARRRRDLRRPGAPRAALVAALPAGRRPGQLRLARQRPGRRAAVHRVPDGAAGHGDGPRHRPGHRRLPATTTTAGPRSRSSCRPVPEPAGQRLGRHRGRHGHQHPAAQPARGRRRARSGPGQHPEATREELLDAADRPGSRARTSPPAR